MTSFSLVIIIVATFQDVSLGLLYQSSPSYSPVCPGDNVVFTCTTNTGFVSWADNSDGDGKNGYNSANAIGQPPRQLGIFKIALISVNGMMFVSTATVDNVTYSHSSSNIYCSADAINFNDMDTLTVRDLDQLGSPIGLSAVVLDNSQVQLTWSPPSDHSICINKYTIRVISDTVGDKTANTSGNMTIFRIMELSSGNVYNFSVAGVDKRDIIGLFSKLVITDLSVPDKVINLQHNITYIGSNNVNITLYWNSPLTLLYRPNITHYNIYHNTSSIISHDITILTYYVLSNVPTGHTYFISISSENVVGKGDNNTIYVYPTTTIAPTSTTITDTLYFDSTSFSVAISTYYVLNESSLSVSEIAGSQSSNQNFPSGHSKTVTTSLKNPSSPVINTSPTNRNQNNSANGTSLQLVGGVIGGIITALIIVSVIMITAGCIYMKKRANYKPSSHNKANSTEEKIINFFSEATHNEIELSDPTYDEVQKNPQLLQHDEVSPPVPPYSDDNDQPPPLPLFYGGDEPPVASYIGPVIAHYSEVKRELVTLHVLPQNSIAAGGDYSVLKRDDISHVSLHNVTAGGDYSVIKRDDVPNAPPHSTPAGGDYSVLKKKERESRENNSQLQQTGLYSTLNYELNKQTGAATEPKGAGGIIYAELGNDPKNRPTVPPPSNLGESVIYSDIKAPTNPNKRLSVRGAIIHAQLGDLEIPPPRPPKPGPKPSSHDNGEQSTTITSSIHHL